MHPPGTGRVSAAFGAQPGPRLSSQPSGRGTSSSHGVHVGATGGKSAGARVSARLQRQEGGTVEERSPADVLKLVEDNGIEVVDFRFCDLPGLMQHFSAPAHVLAEDVFEDGLGFDGSSIRGFQEIQESDMILIPDANTAVIDPFRQHPTLNINCFVRDPVTGEPSSRDPRYVSRKAEDYLRSTGLADTAYFGPEAEFYIFNDIRF